MNEEIFFPTHRGTPLEVLVGSFATEARDFFVNAWDYNLDIEDLDVADLEQSVSKYSAEFSNIMDTVEYLMEKIDEVVYDVGHAIPTDE